MWQRTQCHIPREERLPRRCRRCVAVRLGAFKRARARSRCSPEHSCPKRILGKKWPMPDGDVSLTLDSYVSCHLLEDEECHAFRHELRRVTRSGGLVYTAGFATDDEYYAGLLSEKGVRIVIDPNNGVAKRVVHTASTSISFRKTLMWSSRRTFASMTPYLGAGIGGAFSR